MRKLGTWILAGCFWLVTGVVAVLTVLLTMNTDCSGDVIELVCRERRRFYACLLLSLAIAGNALWLAPNPRLGLTLGAGVVVMGILVGVLWECRARR
jgi:hypothetical protein